MLDGVPFGQPALSLAAQLQRRAERAAVPAELTWLDGDVSRAPGRAGGTGTDGPSAEGPSSNDADGGIGRELFALVAKARAAGVDPEMALRAAARQFEKAVRAWEHPES